MNMGIADNTSDSTNLNTVGNRIVSIAQPFVGVTETVPNKEWSRNTQELLELMIPTGWTLGNQYCAAFAFGTWIRAYGGDTRINSFNPVGILSWELFDKYLLETEPKVGAMFFIHFSDGRGHVGLVTDVQPESFTAIEANIGVILNGQTVEGIFATTHTRGPHILGFKNPI